MDDALGAARVPFPEGGALRVHLEPWYVYQPEPEANGVPQERGPNRFDDPQHRYPVRYLAEQLHVCLLEVMARFRANVKATAAEASVEHLDDPELDEYADPEQVEGVENFLATNQVGLFKPPPSAPLSWVLDVFNPDLLSALDEHDRIQRLLCQPEVVKAFGDDHGNVHLDGSLIRNAHRKVGRPVTQEISFLLLHVRSVQGLRYQSRHAEGAQATCWALHGNVPMDMKSAEHLDPANDVHREAVQYVSTRYGLPLPVAWAAAVDEH